ncbi:MAG: hypothetical protein QXH12_06925 [Candidatus Caldarchaeum sp.]|uniref:Uncharacterized protein n=1 Tax=Caldiarchaeum subterraneum TaxID=311458 RepID=A0A7C5L846_CALS0
MRIFLRLESDIPPTLTKYGKMRIPPAALPLLAGKRKNINLRFGSERLTLKIDRYGRTTLPANVASESRGKSKMIIEMKDSEVTLEFQ